MSGPSPAPTATQSHPGNPPQGARDTSAGSLAVAAAGKDRGRTGPPRQAIIDAPPEGTTSGFSSDACQRTWIHVIGPGDSRDPGVPREVLNRAWPARGAPRLAGKQTHALAAGITARLAGASSASHPDRSRTPSTTISALSAACEGILSAGLRCINMQADERMLSWPGPVGRVRFRPRTGGLCGRRGPALARPERSFLGAEASDDRTPAAAPVMRDCGRPAVGSHDGRPPACLTRQRYARQGLEMMLRKLLMRLTVAPPPPNAR